MRHRPPHSTLLAALCVAAIVNAGGCALFRQGGLAPGADAFVVATESTLKVAHNNVKRFLRVDDQNRAFVKAKLPGVHAFAESLRQRDPQTGVALEIQVVRAAYAAIQTYKVSRSPDDRQKAEDALSAVETLADQARAYLAAISEQQTAAAASQPAGP